MWSQNKLSHPHEPHSQQEVCCSQKDEAVLFVHFHFQEQAAYINMCFNEAIPKIGIETSLHEWLHVQLEEAGTFQWVWVRNPSLGLELFTVSDVKYKSAAKLKQANKYPRLIL